jgi:hypothetical protein
MSICPPTILGTISCNQGPGDESGAAGTVDISESRGQRQFALIRRQGIFKRCTLRVHGLDAAQLDQQNQKKRTPQSAIFIRLQVGNQRQVTAPVLTCLRAALILPEMRQNGGRPQ